MGTGWEGELCIRTVGGDLESTNGGMQNEDRSDDYDRVVERRYKREEKFSGEGCEMVFRCGIRELV